MLKKNLCIRTQQKYITLTSDDKLILCSHVDGVKLAKIYIKVINLVFTTSPHTYFLQGKHETYFSKAKHNLELQTLSMLHRYKFTVQIWGHLHQI